MMTMPIVITTKIRRDTVDTCHENACHHNNSGLLRLHKRNALLRQQSQFLREMIAKSRNANLTFRAQRNAIQGVTSFRKSIHRMSGYQGYQPDIKDILMDITRILTKFELNF